MQDKSLTEHLSFLVSQRGQDEATILAQALRAGIEALYREALVYTVSAQTAPIMEATLQRLTR